MDKIDLNLSKEMALTEAIRMAGGLRKLAKLCRTDHQKLCKIRAGELKMKLEIALNIQLALGIPAVLFRPDQHEVIEQFTQLCVSDQLNNMPYVLHPLSIKINKHQIPAPEKVALLKDSMQKNGQYRPIAITADRKLIYGRARLMAVRALGWREIKCIVIDINALWTHQIPANIFVKNLSKVESYKLAQYLLKHCRGYKLPVGLKRSLEVELLEDERAQQIAMAWEKMRQAPGPTVRLDDYVSHLSGLGGRQNFNHVQKIMRSGSQLLILLLDNERISVHTACEVAKLHPEVQMDILALKNNKAIKKALQRYQH